MTPDAQREQAETSLASNTRFGPHNMTAVLRLLEIIVGVIFSHSPDGVMKRDRSMEGVELLALRWRTRQSRSAFGHRSGSLESLWPILLPLTPFFCFMKVSVMNVVA